MMRIHSRVQRAIHLLAPMGNKSDLCGHHRPRPRGKVNRDANAVTSGLWWIRSSGLTRLGTSTEKCLISGFYFYFYLNLCIFIAHHPRHPRAIQMTRVRRVGYSPLSISVRWTIVAESSRNVGCISCFPARSDIAG